eukprot:gene9743-6831_t
MSELLLLYQTEIQEHLRVAGEVQKDVSNSLRLLRACRDDPSVVYTPPPASGPESRPHKIRDGLSRLSEARDLLNNMQSEINEQPQSQRKRLQQIAHTYQREVDRLEGELGRLRDETAAAAQEELFLFHSTGSDAAGGLLNNRVDNITEAQRRAATTTTLRLQSGTGHLERAEQLLYKTNVTGRDTFQTLQGQREQIQGVGETLHDVDGEISQATAIMRDMRRTAQKHKLYLYGAMGLVLLVTVIMVVSKFWGWVAQKGLIIILSALSVAELTHILILHATRQCTQVVVAVLRVGEMHRKDWRSNMLRFCLPFPPHDAMCYGYRCRNRLALFHVSLSLFVFWCCSLPFTELYISFTFLFFFLSVFLAYIG